MSSFEEIEDQDGVRMSWNVFVSSKAEASRLVVPIGCTYTMLKKKYDMQLLFQEPQHCKTCNAILNPYCQIDVRARLWVCPFCLQRNGFPPHYHDISNNALPPELLPQFTTAEYVLPRPTPPPIFIFVVDTCLDIDDLNALRDELIVGLSLIPPQALVGLITFGTMVHLHELSHESMLKSHVFKGGKDYTAEKLQEMLGLSVPKKSGAPQPQQQQQFSAAAAKYILPLQQCEFTLTSILEQLTRDPWPVESGNRPQRSTGSAMNLAVSLLEAAFPNTGARVMLFAGGPCTVGSGQVVGVELKEMMRSHNDLEKDHAKHVKKATKFYDSLASRAASNGHTIDIFAGCLDQVGLMEMRNMVNMSGGYMILSDSFQTIVFKKSFQKVFDRDENDQLDMGFNATLEVSTSREFKVCGLIGSCVSGQKKAQNVSDTEIGIGGTNQWKFCGISPKSTAALYFEVVNQANQPMAGGSRGVLQFVTKYQHACGQYRCRVTTVARNWADASSPDIPASFDQEAAAVLMARIAIFKAELDDGPDVLRWLDRMLIHLCQKFADYRKNDPSSFRLSDNFSIYPQFMYNYRRSQFLQVFNNSPDETAFYRHVLNREDVMNSLIMIQPTLTSYSYTEPAQPVLLDSVSAKPDVILLLDTFFHILIWHGETIAQWRNEKYHEQEEYASFKELLEAPKVDAQELLQDRFPVPRFINCDQGGSQARFLLSKLNPSTTHTTMATGGAGGYYGGQQMQQSQQASGAQPIFTDDVSLQTFMEHLKKLAVAGTN
ncbi:hypothetical protein MIR68_005686 [Amoeboaphelidium protococcarum]|nr:hypothetical protein MIR68_005686 [Amoeboaphelidium protococcarum]KAI3648597.1 hypothetical protein MP228_006451 [Amoeboaphelidium protococcarum]